MLEVKRKKTTQFEWFLFLNQYGFKLIYLKINDFQMHDLKCILEFQFPNLHL